MEGFKKSNKMQCFKEGKSVKYKSRHSEKHEMSEDIAKDKAIVKKAFKMHDTQSHEGEKTNLSKLNKGGRAKKNVGTVKKYKTGGCVNKYADGQEVVADNPDDIGGSLLRKIGKVPMVGGMLEKGATRLRNNVMGTPEQNRIAREQRLAMERRKAAAAAAAMGAQPAGIAGAAQQAAPAPAGMKKGRKVKKMNTGGSTGPISQTAQEIIEGKRPAQSTPGKMTPEERRASIAKAFGAK